MSDKTNSMKTAVVSFSGGMDSTCLVLYLLSKGHSVHAVSFNYGQSHSIELKRASQIAKYLQKLGLSIDHEIIDLRSVFNMSQSTLVKGEHAPEGHYADEMMKSTVVENRNVIFSSIVFSKALSFAKMNLDMLKYNAGTDPQQHVSEKELRDQAKVVISLGVHAGDHAIYPDCTDESVNMARELFRISNWDSDLVVYDAPFVDYSKAEVLNVGRSSAKELGLKNLQINTIFRKSVSCYNANETGKSCGKCGTCTERLEAFWNNGLNDPAKYVDPDMGKRPKHWNEVEYDG